MALDRRKILLSEVDTSTIEILTSLLQLTRRSLLKAVMGADQDETDWIYKPGWNSIGMILAHVASMDRVALILYLERRTLTQNESNRYLLAHAGNMQKNADLLKGRSLEWLLSEIEMARSALLERLISIDPAELERRIGASSSGETFNLLWLIAHRAEDEANHRGQIILIRRLFRERGGRIRTARSGRV